MSRRDDVDSYDDYAPRVRADRRGSRPRTKHRPSHEGALRGFVIGVDRGRYRVILGEGSADEGIITCTRARELRGEAIVIGDVVECVGDTSGAEGSLARIVRLRPRTTVLRRSGDDTDTIERIIVANADQLLMVVAAASPEPRIRLIDRYVVAALDAGLRPLMCVTKTDIAPADELRAYANALSIDLIERSPDSLALEEIAPLLQAHTTVLVGHSGVGKSTLVNDLVPGTDRAVGRVNEVTGRGRHTSSSSVALPLPTGGWIIDTPGIRSFGLGHISSSSIVAGFSDLESFTLNCPKACTHESGVSQCELEKAITAGVLDDMLMARANSLQRLMATIHHSPGSSD
jgi:ribosome biogenesis GTPase